MELLLLSNIFRGPPTGVGVGTSATLVRNVKHINIAYTQMVPSKYQNKGTNKPLLYRLLDCGV